MIVQVHPSIIRFTGYFAMFALLSMLPTNLTYAQDASYRSQLHEKNLLIRNLRRQIFDLERELTLSNNPDAYKAEIRKLQKDIATQAEKNKQDAEAEILSLKSKIRQLESDLDRIKKDKDAAVAGQAADMKQQIKILENQLSEKTNALNQANEITVKVTSQKADLEDKFNKLQAEFEGTLEQLDKLANENKKLSRKKKKLVAEANKPLNKRIQELESSLDSIRQQRLEDEQALIDEKDQLKVQFEKKISESKGQSTALLKQIENLKVQSQKHDIEFSELKVAVTKKEEEVNSLKNEIDQLNGKLRNKDERILAVEADVNKLRSDEIELKNVILKKDEELFNKNNQLVAEQKNIKDVQVPLLKKIKDLESELTQISTEKKEMENDLLRSEKELADQSDNITNYQKVLSANETEIKEIKGKLAQRENELSKAIESAREPLLSKIKTLEERNKKSNKMLEDETLKIKKESQREINNLKSELSAAKIDEEYKQEQLDKANSIKIKLTNDIVKLEKQVDLLSNELSQSLKVTENERVLEAKHNALSEENKELKEKLDILLKENAEFQKKMAAVATITEHQDDIKDMKADLLEAEDLIVGFREDVDAKTNEISSLSDENRDLRAKLKTYMKKSNGLEKLIQDYENKLQDNRELKKMTSLKEQNDLLKTALSKTKQELAQQDATFKKLVEEKEILSRDVKALTKELNLKIQHIGELELHTRTAGKSYSEAEWIQMKKPMLAEIETLKERVVGLEAQLMDTWNTAEDMLLELKNHPTIRQVDNTLEAEPNKAQ